MYRRANQRIFLLTATVSLLLLACVIDEDLHIYGDGSGTYRVRITIPREFASDFSKLRGEAEKNGFEIVQEGETEKTRFLVIRKSFTDITALNDSNTRFELTITDSGFLRRDYHLRASLGSVVFGSFKRHFVVTMPGKVSSTTDGEIDGSRVKWESSSRGSLEAVSSGFYFPLTRGQNAALLTTIIAGLLLLIVARARRHRPAAALCLTCNSPAPGNARFCQTCGGSIPAAEA